MRRIGSISIVVRGIVGTIMAIVGERIPVIIIRIIWEQRIVTILIFVLIVVVVVTHGHGKIIQIRGRSIIIHNHRGSSSIIIIIMHRWLSPVGWPL